MRLLVIFYLCAVFVDFVYSFENVEIGLFEGCEVGNRYFLAVVVKSELLVLFGIEFLESASSLHKLRNALFSIAELFSCKFITIKGVNLTDS